MHTLALPVGLDRYVAANLLWRHHCTASFPADACTFQQRRKLLAPHFKLFLISATMALCHLVGVRAELLSSFGVVARVLHTAAAAERLSDFTH